MIDKKIGYSLSLTGEVGGSMVYNHTVSFLIPKAFLSYFLSSFHGLLFESFNSDTGKNILVAGQDMDYLHCYNTEDFWNRQFVIPQWRTIVPLNSWMAWCSYPKKLFKGTSSTCFIWILKLKNGLVWHIFMQCHSLIPCSICTCFLFFPILM